VGGVKKRVNPESHLKAERGEIEEKKRETYAHREPVRNLNWKERVIGGGRQIDPRKLGEQAIHTGPESEEGGRGKKQTGRWGRGKRRGKAQEGAGKTYAGLRLLKKTTFILGKDN